MIKNQNEIKKHYFLYNNFLKSDLTNKNIIYEPVIET